MILLTRGRQARPLALQDARYDAGKKGLRFLEKLTGSRGSMSTLRICGEEKNRQQMWTKTAGVIRVNSQEHEARFQTSFPFSAKKPCPHLSICTYTLTQSAGESDVWTPSGVYVTIKEHKQANELMYPALYLCFPEEKMKV